MNPDNVATPIAASLGDVTTLSLLAWIADLLYKDMDKGLYTAPILIGGNRSRRIKILCNGWEHYVPYRCL